MTLYSPLGIKVGQKAVKHYPLDNITRKIVTSQQWLPSLSQCINNQSWKWEGLVGLYHSLLNFGYWQILRAGRSLFSVVHPMLITPDSSGQPPWSQHWPLLNPVCDNSDNNNKTQKSTGLKVERFVRRKGAGHGWQADKRGQGLRGVNMHWVYVWDYAISHFDQIKSKVNL